MAFVFEELTILVTTYNS